MSSKILLLEDDVSLSETVSEYLEDNGFDVISVYDGERAEELMYEQSFELYLLDVNVPMLDGFELLEKTRQKGDKTPCIYITSLNSIDSLEKGYQKGCDDYIRKPFELKELLIRVKTMIKKGYFHHKKETLAIDKDIEFDLINEQLLIKNNVYPLHSKEKKLLKLFLQHQNEIISHERIAQSVWSYDETPSDTSLRTYIKNIRKAIGKEKIVSVKKIGYEFISK